MVFDNKEQKEALLFVIDHMAIPQSTYAAIIPEITKLAMLRKAVEEGEVKNKEVSANDL